MAWAQFNSKVGWAPSEAGVLLPAPTYFWAALKNKLISKMEEDHSVLSNELIEFMKLHGYKHIRELTQKKVTVLMNELGFNYRLAMEVIKISKSLPDQLKC